MAREEIGNAQQRHDRNSRLCSYPCPEGIKLKSKN
jgi:hypothetical protein